MDGNFTRAYERPDFLSSADARGIRILSEYYEPLQRFNSEQIWHTVIFFGSARILSHDQALREYNEFAHLPTNSKERRRAKMKLDMSRYYEDARRLAGMLTRWSLSLPSDVRMYVCSGGGSGIMEAANRGASEAGGKTLSLNIQLPLEQSPNPWSQDQLTFNFHYFFMRKFWFAYRAKASIAFPGGFGTLDELMELLTLTQTRRVDKSIPIVIYGRDYWERVVNLDALADTGMISPDDLELFHFADTPEEAFEHITSAFVLTDDATPTQPIS